MLSHFDQTRAPIRPLPPQEAVLDAFSHFSTRIDGCPVQFTHLRSPEAGAMPLLLARSWPGSPAHVAERFERLTNPRVHGHTGRDAFHLVCPQLPGHELWRAGRIYVALMARLGYPRFAVHAGDFGEVLARELEHLAPERIIGVHVLETGRGRAGGWDELDSLRGFFRLFR